jgi:hypothetical protein
MARIDHLTGGIYRISTYAPEKRISFNQFLIDDNNPALIHTGTFPMYDRGWQSFWRSQPVALRQQAALSGTQKSTRHAGWMAGEYAIHCADWQSPPSLAFAYMPKKSYIGGNIRRQRAGRLQRSGEVFGRLIYRRSTYDGSSHRRYAKLSVRVEPA